MTRINLNNSEVKCIDKGVFVSSGTILKVEDWSNHPLIPEKKMIGKFPTELCLKAYIDVGMEWEKHFTTFGKYSVDKVTGKIKWIQRGNSVLQFLVACLEDLPAFRAIEDATEFIAKVTNEKGLVRDTVLKMLEGTEIQFVSYPISFDEEKKVLRKNDLMHTFKATDSLEYIQSVWDEQKKWQKKYTPEAYQIYLDSKKSESDTKFEYGANAEKESEEDVI